MHGNHNSMHVLQWTDFDKTTLPFNLVMDLAISYPLLKILQQKKNIT